MSSFVHVMDYLVLVVYGPVCLATRMLIQKSRDDQPPQTMRTLNSLASDYQRFKDDGFPLTRAKYFNNAIRPALLPIPVEDVCIPALHLDIGIYLRIFEAMLSYLRCLDLMLAQHLGASGTTDDDSKLFTEAATLSTELSSKLKQQGQLQEKVKLLETQVMDCVTSGFVLYNTKEDS